jgi:hypothetical protein
MEITMADATSTTETAAVETSDGSATTATPTDTATESETVTQGETALGDAGKKALDAMKAERNADREARKALEAEFAAFKAKAEGKEAEYAAEQAAQKVKDEALAVANDRILKAEIRAAAASKLADPADALRFIDMSAFEVGADGEVDASAINSAIENLISTKPYLAAQGGKKFQGSADGGARNESTKTAQLTSDDMSRMSPEQKVAAYESGQFDTLLGRS